jgi:prevent-host-death family protein
MLAKKRKVVAVVNMHEAKTGLSRLVERARRGEEILIARDGEPVVRLVAIKRLRGQRPVGAYAGQIEIGPDFDAPMPDEYSGISKP